MIALDQLPLNIRETIARVLLALLALALIWVLRRLAIALLARPFRLLAQRTNSTQLEQNVRDVVSAPARFLIMALALTVAGRILALDAGASVLVERIIRSLVVLAVFLLLYSLIRITAFSPARMFAFTGITIEDALLPFVRTTLQFLVLAFAVIIVIQVWGYDVSGLVAGLGLGGLAFSLAAQDTISNLFGFSMIVGDRPFVVGEFIKTPDVQGTVEHVGLRSTRIRQLDQALVTVPNSKLANSVILNWSRLGKRQIDFVLRLTYTATPEDIEQIMTDIRAMLAAREKVDRESIVVHFINFGETAFEVIVRCYINQPDWLAFTQEREQINFEIMRIVARDDQRIAFPGQTLYIEQINPPNGSHNTGTYTPTDIRTTGG